jgi:hypothetical protein
MQMAQAAIYMRSMVTLHEAVAAIIVTSYLSVRKCSSADTETAETLIFPNEHVILPECCQRKLKKCRN